MIHTELAGRELPHVCSYCDMSFKSSSILENHIKNLHEIVYLQCGLCSCEFKTKGLLYSHHVKKHMDKKELFTKVIDGYKCMECDVVKKSGIEYHVALCNPKSLFCKGVFSKKVEPVVSDEDNNEDIEDLDIVVFVPAFRYN